MEDLIKSVEDCMATGNWYAALILVLTLPDIVGKIEYPNKKSSERYTTWFTTFVNEKYHNWLPGNECYALRCAYLHEGSSDTSNQSANQHKSTNKYLFFEPKEGMFHFLKAGDTLEMQIDIFCNDILEGIRTWLASIQNDQQKLKKLNEFLSIYAIRGF